jgi:uncharacterized protein YbjT (DUF2867 family)
MTAFIAGATGYTGHELVKELRAASRVTHAHVRHDSSRLDEWKKRFAALGASVDTTPWELDAMSETLARIQPVTVFALLGTTKARQRATGGSDDYEKVDYGLTHLLLEACKRSAKHARFIYLSAAGVTPDTKNAYLAVRARIERELADSGLAYTVARPSFITGPDREETRVGEQVGAALADAALTVAKLVGAKRVAARYQSTTASILAKALARIAYDPAFEKRIVESEALR